MGREVTQQKIARRARVSQATVSLVLSGRDAGISARTRQQVLDAAHKLGYGRVEPSRHRTGTVAYLLERRVTFGSETFRAHYQEVLSGIQRGLAEARCHTLLGYADSPRSHLEDLCARVDGVIIQDWIAETTLEWLAARVPVVLQGWHAAGQPYDSVMLDHEACLHRTVAHLAKLGHSRIAFLAHQPADPAHAQRHEGYLKAMAVLKLTPMDEPCFFPRTKEHTYEETEGLVREVLKGAFRLPAPPTALVCPSDTWALPVLKVARELGIPVPGRLSVFGFDAIDEGLRSTPRLSSVRAPSEAMGRRTAEVLRTRLEHPQGPAQRVLFNGELVLLDSVAPPPAEAENGERNAP